MVFQMAPARASVWGYAASSAIGDIVVVTLSSRFSTQSYKANVTSGDHLHVIMYFVN